MKKLFLILALFVLSCSNDNEQPQEQQQETCYQIISRGYDARGNFIIVKISNYNNKRYSVSNYQNYINQSKICEPINLTEQPL